MGLPADDVNLVLSPLHHSAPLRFAMGTLLAGGRVVVPGPFDPATVTAAIVEERPTSMFCVPAHLQRLFAHWDEQARPTSRRSGWSRTPVRRARTRSSGAWSRVPRRSTWEFYGSTEGQFTACRSEEWLERPGTLGRARPGRSMSVDDEGRIGAWCRLTRASATSAIPRRPPRPGGGSAFTVGDLGRVEEDGYVYLDGRREDLVISGGVNVYPAEVEQVLAELAGVEDVAVFGVDDGAGASGSVPRWSARSTTPPSTRTPASTWPPRSGPRSTTGSTRSPHADRQGRRLDLPDLMAGGGLMGFTTEELEAFRDIEVPDLLPEAPTCEAAVRRHQPRACGRRPCRPTSRTRPTGSTRRCSAPAS